MNDNLLQPKILTKRAYRAYNQVID